MNKKLLCGSILTSICLGLAVVTISLSGCALYPRHLINPTYIVRDVRPHVSIALPISESTIDFDWILTVENSNTVGLHLASVDFDLLVDDDPILSSISEQKIDIPPNGSADVRLISRVGYRNLRSLFRKVADRIQGEHAHYTIRGHAHYDTIFGRLTFPINVRH